MAYDQHQRFVQFVPGGNGVIYAIQADGLLLRYEHSGWLTGTPTWANGAGAQIGNGFQQFRTVFAAADGQIFGVTASGDLRWYKHLGGGAWHVNSGSTIRTGLQVYPRIFGGWNGVFYAVDTNGKLRWFKYLAGDGTNSWHTNSGNIISNNSWKPFYELWADPNGVIYGIHTGSNVLQWWRYTSGDGTNGTWVNGGNAYSIGSGWSDDTQKTWLSNGSGTHYVVWLDGATTPGFDDKLMWFRLLNSETISGNFTGQWVNGGAPLQVGSGFTIEKTASLQGYATDTSPRPTYPQGFAVSSSFTTVEATIERLAVPGQTSGTVVWGPQSVAGSLQYVPGDYRSGGCDWATTFSLTIPATWKSGAYVCRLRGLLNGTPHLRYEIPFAVKPPAPTAKLAVLLPTNTYNAYNTWGGHNNYTTVGQGGVQRVCTSFRPNNAVWTDDRAVLSHTYYSDLLLLRWMVQNNIEFDLYQDGDLNADGTWLGQYKALVIGSHSEYWSQLMKDRVNTYLSNGGRVVNTGGNTLFARISWNAGGDAVVFRAANGSQTDNWYANLGQPTRDVLGADWDDSEFLTWGAYETLLPAHPFLAGTSLSLGSTFGAVSYNISGSGWETDRCPTPPKPGTEIIAVGNNSGGPNGGHMFKWTRSGGGWVFSTGSISFNGTLAVDAVASKILLNVMTAAAL
ncbi:N,N-dimethylformamidase beta subunit family domain-containing protein [Lentzea kentuckyensis]|uniref:N,N-dimethylformamidase beta subunit family domain-containing protein n=1 Tax=Lentzea kentuckyensis TaxID=360086 RepID=UPI000A3ADFF8|nr:N,N-dimethylformamidase beta subunit family domain-containing protein [Lentzea kentuckyensis]